VGKTLSLLGNREVGERAKEEIDPYRVLQLVRDYLDKKKEALRIHHGEAEREILKGRPEEEVILKEK
jgi:hypothetical protein